MNGRIPARPARLVAALLAAIGAMALAAGAANASEVVYNNIPSPLSQGGLPALGFESDSVAEFGGEVQLAGSARTSPTVGVELESYACQTGSGAACTTAMGATFEWPITLSIYKVGSLSSPIARITKTFKIHYRPSASAKCPLEMPEGVKGYGKECAFAKADKVSFALPGAKLPATAIIAVSYNTETYGSEPTGTEGPYDSLNVAIDASYVCNPAHLNKGACEGEDYERVPVAPPSVGSDPLPEQVFLNTTYGAIDCGGTLGSFSATGLQTEPECNWKYEQPAFEVKAN